MEMGSPEWNHWFVKQSQRLDREYERYETLRQKYRKETEDLAKLDVENCQKEKDSIDQAQHEHR